MSLPDIKSVLRSLYALNQIDVRIQALLDSKSEIPQVLASLLADRHSLENAVSELESNLAASIAQKDTHEQHIAQKKQWLIEREPAINSLSTQREYQAAIKEIAQSKKDINDREKIIADLVSKITSLTAQLDEIKTRNTLQVEELTQKISAQQNILAALDDKIKDESLGRSDYQNRVDAATMAKYQRILSKGAPAITLAQNGTCSECSTKLPPQLYNCVLALKEIILCPHCQRILITEEITLPGHS